MRILLIILLFSNTVAAQVPDFVNLPLWTGATDFSNNAAVTAAFGSLTITGWRFSGPDASQNGNVLRFGGCSGIVFKKNMVDNASGGTGNYGIYFHDGGAITIDSNLFWNDGGGMLIASCSDDILVRYNQFLNSTTRYPIGQHIAIRYCTGTNIRVLYNRMENHYGESYPEDAISMYQTSGTSGDHAQVRHNYISGGGPSKSGGGIVSGESDVAGVSEGSYIDTDSNFLFMPGNYLTAIVGGTNNRMRGNKGYQLQRLWSNNGYLAYSNCLLVTVTDNADSVVCGNAANCTPGAVNNYYFPGAECTGTRDVPSSITLAQLAFPTPLLTYITEDETWQLRSDTSYQMYLIGAALTQDGYARDDVQRPRPNAGADQSISVTTVTLDASGSQAGTSGGSSAISAYHWVLVSGPSLSVITSPNSSSTTVTNLKNGTYVFRLEVTATVPNYSQQADWITVTVSGLTAGVNYYFANAGSDGAAGTLIAPWQTTTKFNSYFASTSPGDSLLFKAGDTFSGTLIISRSGSAGSPIVIGRYGTGADPIITGLTTISAWSNLGSNIWESTAAVSTLPITNIVAINGVNTAMGRYPNSGYLTFQSHVTNTTITSSSLNSATTDWTGSELVIRKNNWVIDRAPITAHSGGTLTYTSPDAYNGIDGYGFYIQNDSRTLDIANEWYYNPSTKKLSVYATSSPTNVQVATKDTLVYMLYRNYITFDNISFQGANKDGFVILSSNNVTIQNCSIDYSGANGVWGATNFGLPSSDFVFQNSTINHTNDIAINLSTEFAGALISNNTIRNTGINAGMGGNGSYSGGTLTGVRLRGDSMTVEYNVIDSTGYAGIAFFGSDIQIRNNFVTNFCTQKIDGGGIYTWFGYTTPSTYTGQKVYNNIVLNGNGSNVGTTQTGAPIVHGIYLDDGSANIEVYGNTCANNDYSGIYIHNASSCNVHDNTAYNNGIEQMLITSYTPSYPKTGLIIQNNIAFSKTAIQKTSSWETVVDDISNFGTPSTINNNYYARPIDDNTTIQTKINGGATTTQRTLAGWVTYSGFDVNSNKSPKTITDVNDLRFEYNATNASVVVPLSFNYMDVTGTTHNGTITIPAYSSAVLIKNGAITTGSHVPMIFRGFRLIFLPRS